MTDPVKFDAAALQELSAAFRRVAPQTYKASQKVIRTAALEILADADTRVSYSRRIARTGRVTMRGLNAVISFGGDAAPNASPIENDGKGFVRHPVFGNMDVWTDKNSHPPFLHPAFLVHSKGVYEALAGAVADATTVVLEER